MSFIEREMDIRTGRRDGDGHVHVSIFANEMVALMLEGHSERSPTLLLTLEQARRLQSALAELIPLIEKARNEKSGQTWDGEERRRLAS